MLGIGQCSDLCLLQLTLDLQKLSVQTLVYVPVCGQRCQLPQKFWRERHRRTFQYALVCFCSSTRMPVFHYFSTLQVQLSSNALPADLLQLRIQPQMQRPQPCIDLSTSSHGCVRSNLHNKFLILCNHQRSASLNEPWLIYGQTRL